MTGVMDRPQRAKARRRHPTARKTPDGRGPRRPVGRRTPTFLVLFLTVTALVCFGVVMVLSATAAASQAETNSAWSLFKRQGMWTGLGFVSMFVMMRIPYQRLRVLAVPGIVISLALLMAVFSRFGVTTNGATRWISFGPATFQPSEIVKIAVVLFVADLLSRRPASRSAITLRPVLVVMLPLVLLLMMQPHLGATLIIGVVVLTMFYMAGAPLHHLLGLTSVGLFAAAAMVKLSPWRWQRIMAYRDPFADPLDTGYQTLQSLHAITMGGLSGVGLGSSRAKYGFLPYAHTDFIFAVIAEELGVIGSLTVIGLFVVFGVAGYTAAVRAPDTFGMLLAVGITTVVVAQAILNVGAVMALLPVTGVTLPFLSFGGTSLVCTMAGAGILFNVARQGR